MALASETCNKDPLCTSFSIYAPNADALLKEDPGSRGCTYIHPVYHFNWVEDPLQYCFYEKIGQCMWDGFVIPYMSRTLLDESVDVLLVRYWYFF